MGDHARYLVRHALYGCFRKVTDERDGPPCVVEVPVGENDIIQIMQADAHLGCIGEECIRVSGIEQDLLSHRFKENRKPGLADEIPVRKGSVIDKNREGETAESWRSITHKRR